MYPEIAAALAVMIAFVDDGQDRHGTIAGCWPWIAVGLAIASLPWLSTKYAPMSAALLLVVILRLGNKGTWLHLLAYGIRKRGRSWRFMRISLAGWFAFFYAIWGMPLPMAPYGSMTQTTPLNLRVRRARACCSIRNTGCSRYAPVYILAATGLCQMWRAGGELRRQAIEITLIFGALLATVGAFRIWWGGSAAPARPLASGLLLLLLPIAVAFRAAPAGSAAPRRAASAAVGQRRHRASR